MKKKQEKHARFERLAEKRTNQVLEKLDVLGNCANRSNYNYSEIEVRKIFKAINKKVREVKSRFRVPESSNDQFKL